MEAYIQRDFTKDCRIHFEHDIAYNGYSYLLIYGEHINGAFIAIPNWEISCEASVRSDDVFFNTEMLQQAGLKKVTAEAIATYIKEAMFVINSRENDNIV